MQIIIAHSDTASIEQLKSFFHNRNITSITVFSNGFDALAYIIKNQPNTVLIEKILPGLDAKNIQDILILKRIKTKLVVVHSDLVLDTTICSSII